MVTKDQVQQLIKETKEEYRSNPKRLKADYNAEKEYNKDYDGRQILEIIQNCDDEEADEIHISLNTDEYLLTVSNSGRPFSFGGYESLMMAHLSPKLSKRQYIGNKGLGFRSLINWANSIEIYSNGFGIGFRKAAKQQVFNELFDNSEQEKIRHDLNLKDHVVPIPLLAIPEIVNSYPENQYTTTVELEYDERYEDKIHEQIDEIEPETLVFVRNISRIIINVDGDETEFACNRERLSSESDDQLLPYERITIGDDSWTVFRKEEELPEDENSDKKEPDFYEIKLALKDNLNDENSWLYSYFRTRIKSHFPFLIHATFDLTLDRNSLTESPKNETVINELVSFIIDVALQLSREEVNWMPLKMLHLGLNKPNEILDELGFYDEIEKAIDHEPIFPCVDGQYRTKEEVRYWTPGFSSLIQEQGWENIFSNVIIPPDRSVRVSSFYLKGEIEQIEEIASSLSDQITDLKVRTAIIDQIVQSKVEGDFSSLFLNQKGEKLGKQQLVFTPVQENLDIPEHCRFTIIQEALFNELSELFATNLASNPAQELIVELGDIVNLKAYDATTIAGEIVSQTNELLNNGDYSIKDSISMVRDQLECLYAMENMPSLKGDDVHIITEANGIRKAQDLFLSDAYQTGQEAISIMGEIYDLDDYVAPPKVLSLADMPPAKTEDFLTKLGVHEYLKILEEEERTNILTGDLKKYFNKYRYQVDAQNKERYSEYLKYAGLYNFDQLRNLSQTQWISLLHFDSHRDDVIKKAINSSSKVSYQLRVYSGSVRLNPTFLKYFLREKLFESDEFLIDPPKPMYNDTVIDYADSLFKRLEISKTEINHLLFDLGGVEEFTSLSMNRIKEIIERVHNQKNGETYAQTLYKKVLEACKEKEERIGSCALYALSVNEIKLFPNNEIFYSEKRSVPKSLREYYPVLNIPRHSNTEDVVEYLEVNNLDDIEVEVTAIKYASESQEVFDTEWKKRKPYLLCARLKHITNEADKNRIAGLLNKLKIDLCYSAKYSVGSQEGIITDFEYLQQGQNEYLLKIPESKPINKTLNNQRFIDAIADILGLVFEVRDTNEFRLRLKDAESDFRYVIEENYGEGLYQECRSLLGEATPFYIFWKPILDLKGITTNESVDSSRPLSTLITEELGFKENLEALDYKGILKGLHKNIVKRLFEHLQLSLAEYNSHAEQKLDYRKDNSEKIENYLRDHQELFKNALYQYLLSQKHSEKSKFLTYLKSYQEAIIDFSDHKASASNEFEIQIDKNLYVEFVESLDVLDLDFSRDYEKIDIEKNLELRISEFKEKHFSEEEFELIKKDPYLKSLLIFENSKIPFIRSEINKRSTKAATNNNSSSSLSIVEIEQSRLIDKRSQKRKKGRISKHSGSEEKARVGEESENLVKQALITKYGQDNVRHISLHDDTTGYDFEYKQDKKWRYLEVKTLSKIGIHLSNNQVDFGYNNKEKYDIGIVDREENQLNIFRSVFKNINRSELNPSEYVIQLTEDVTEEVDYLNI